MCGIVGFSGEITRDFLQEGLAALAHRGPDDFGIFSDPMARIGLGHRRLAIVDLTEQGHQPMVSSDGMITIVYNGEIYNHLELRVELENSGFLFRGSSDTEVLLNLYLLKGDAMLSLLNGIFAFALWDANKGSMLVARDALGVKPFYYSAADGVFAFSSEIKSLLRLLPHKCQLDIVSVHRYLSFLWCPGEGTPLKDVRKLLPGHAMWVRSGEIQRHWAWYQLPVFRNDNFAMDESSALAGTVSHLRQAVHRQMMADVPVGAFLSGGLDSSAVVAFAQEINRDMQCFTIEAKGGQEAGTTDDLPFAQTVAKSLGVRLEVVSIDANRMAGDLERMVSQLDEPLADPAPLNVLYISQLARQQGIKVLLSGAGGDDIFTGYRRHRAVQAERYWSWLPHSARAGLARVTAKLDQKHAFSRRLAKLFSGAALDGDERLVEYFRWAREADLLALYTPETRRVIGQELAATPMLDFLKPLGSSVGRLDRMLALEQRFFLPDHNLLYTDKMSMAEGVEVRVPFLDIELVDFAAQIPLQFKQRGSEGKWVLKKAMEPFLPHEVIYRPKTGFGAPLRRWMQHDLRTLLGDLLSVDNLNRRGLFDPAAVQRLIAENDVGKVDGSYTLFSLLCIEIWCRAYLD